MGQRVADGPAPGLEPVPFGPPPDMGAWACLDAVSSMTFAYQGHSMLLEIAHEMRDARRDFAQAVRVDRLLPVLELPTASLAVAAAPTAPSTAGALASMRTVDADAPAPPPAEEPAAADPAVQPQVDGEQAVTPVVTSPTDLAAPPAAGDRRPR